nr:uncharacterized protein LOC129481578 [Symphalangus syndactylus]
MGALHRPKTMGLPPTPPPPPPPTLPGGLGGCRGPVRNRSRQVLPAPPAKQIPFPQLCSTALSSPTIPAWTETDRSPRKPPSLEAGARALSKENPQRLPLLLQRPLDPTPPGTCVSPRTRPAPTFLPAPTLLGLPGPPSSMQRSYSLHAAPQGSTPLCSAVAAAAASVLQDQRGSKGTAFPARHRCFGLEAQHLDQFWIGGYLDQFWLMGCAVVS